MDEETNTTEVTTQQTPVIQESATPPAQQAAPAAPAQNPTPGQEGTANAAADGITPPAFVPNYKFKIMDKEHEVPDFLKEVIKDKDTEKKIIDLLEKAEGLPVAKERLRGERDVFKKQFNDLNSQVTKAGQLYQRGDIDGFLGLLQIPEEKMLQWAADKVSYMQLPPEQRKVLDESINARRQAYALEEETQTWQDKYQQQASQAKQLELNTILNAPAIKNIAESIDKTFGTQGSFFNEVVNYGKFIYATEKRDISAQEAVMAVAQKFSKFLPASTPGAPAQAAPSAAQGQQQKITIPNMGGAKSVSPINTPVKSMEELRKRRDEVIAQNK